MRTVTEPPRSYRNLWLGLVTVVAVSFLVLGCFGREIYHRAPPLPNRVVASA